MSAAGRSVNDGRIWSVVGTIKGESVCDVDKLRMRVVAEDLAICGRPGVVDVMTVWGGRVELCAECYAERYGPFDRGSVGSVGSREVEVVRSIFCHGGGKGCWKVEL